MSLNNLSKGFLTCQNDCKMNSTSNVWTCVNAVSCNVSFVGGLLLNCGQNTRHYVHVKYVCGNNNLIFFKF